MLIGALFTLDLFFTLACLAVAVGAEWGAGMSDSPSASIGAHQTAEMAFAGFIVGLIVLVVLWWSR